MLIISVVTSMSLQHRGGKYGKIVLKHHPLEGLVRLLEPIEALVPVQIIMPGVITSSKRGHAVGGLVLRVQYVAPDGHIRLLARDGGNTQEVRIMCERPDETIELIRQILL